MRDIEGIEEVVRQLAPHWADIDSHFNQENAQFIALFNRDHDVLGRVLKCHLIVEHYVDRFLRDHYQNTDLEGARLSFFQKASLLPNGGSAAAFVKPGVLRLNFIRNRFGHDLLPQLSIGDLGPIAEVLAISRPNLDGEPVRHVEAFATVAATFLIVPPPHLQKLFIEAFQAVRVAPDVGI